MARPSKREAILKTAGDLFVAHGFSRVTIDQIAAAVPISKPTLYANFKDKRALYSAVIQGKCARLLASMTDMVEAGRSVDETLYHIGYEFLVLVLSDTGLQMHRMLAAESDEFPEIAKLFYQSGPEQNHAFIRDYLQRMDDEKKLRVADPALSADMFLSMIKGYAHLKCLLGVAKPLSKKQMEVRVRYAVDLFLRAHAAV